MHIFPYNLVNKDSKVILYGAGVVGQNYHAQLQQNKYVSIIKWVDKDFQSYASGKFKIETIYQKYSLMDFDYVVIAIEKKEIAKQIMRFLVEQGVEQSKIIWQESIVNTSFIEKENKIDGYSVEKNVQIIIALLKKNNIRKIVISPGATNMCFARSVQNDKYFEIYSVIDERSAAYIACGMAEETKSPIVLSCTGATASRNYIPALTEAYYKKLPVLAITSSQYFGRVGNNFPQMIDRRVIQNDIAKYHTRIPMIYREEDYWFATLEINKAINELYSHGGGPIHIDLETEYSSNFNVYELPDIRKIEYFEYDDNFPEIDNSKRIIICIGSHMPFSSDEICKIERFCEDYNAVVFADLLSNYNGKYKVNTALLSSQMKRSKLFESIDIVIYIGNTTAYSFKINPGEVWQIALDGKVKDVFKATTRLYSVNEMTFFERYIKNNDGKSTSYYQQWKQEDNKLRSVTVELPFSNPWISKKTMEMIDKDDCLHLAILNSLRSCNLVAGEKYVESYSNTGGFGIDGCMSTMLGAAMVNTEKTFYLVIGDLAFFYDLNSLGNRHISSNVRIILINNGMGAEFKTYRHSCNIFGAETNTYIAANGHNGCKSNTLVKNYVESLGFEYSSVHNKSEFENVMNSLFSNGKREKPILIEAFTEEQNEHDALKILYNIGNE